MSEALVIRHELDEMVSIDVDACTLYAQAGLDADLGPQHPYSVAERSCWTRCARDGNAFVAGPPDAPPVGLLVMDRIDGAAPHQRIAMRRGAV